MFVSFYGKALDEKAPLLRSMEAVSKAGVKLLGLLGYNCKRVVPNIGLEQERDYYSTTTRWRTSFHTH